MKGLHKRNRQHRKYWPIGWNSLIYSDDLDVFVQQSITEDNTTNTTLNERLIYFQEELPDESHRN
jgi:hypothetical protein